MDDESTKDRGDDGSPVAIMIRAKDAPILRLLLLAGLRVGSDWMLGQFRSRSKSLTQGEPEENVDSGLLRMVADGRHDDGSWLLSLMRIFVCRSQSQQRLHSFILTHPFIASSQSTHHIALRTRISAFAIEEKKKPTNPSSFLSSYSWWLASR